MKEDKRARPRANTLEFHDNRITQRRETMEEVVETAKGLPNDHREAAVVRQLNSRGDITMFGREINDRLVDPKAPVRKTYHVHPYGKEGSGVSCTATCVVDGELYVLLGRKYINARDKKLGLREEYDQVGGYTRPIPLEGGEHRIEGLSEEEKDALEEGMLRGETTATPSTLQSVSHALQGKGFSLNAVGSAIKGIYQKEVLSGEKGFAEPIDPVWMKEQLKGKGVKLPGDYNHEDTAIWEFKEETGIDLVQERIRPQQVTTQDDYAITNDPRLHTKVTHFSIHFGIQESLPETKPGSDIAELTWAPARKLQVPEAGKEDRRVTYGGTPVRLDYGATTLTHVLKFTRDQDMRERIGMDCSSAHTLVSAMGAPLDKPKHEIGEDSAKYYGTLSQYAGNAMASVKKVAGLGVFQNAVQEGAEGLGRPNPQGKGFVSHLG